MYLIFIKLIVVNGIAIVVNPPILSGLGGSLQLCGRFYMHKTIIVMQSSTPVIIRLTKNNKKAPPPRGAFGAEGGT